MKLLAATLLGSLVGCAAAPTTELGSTAGQTYDEFKASVYQEPGTDNFVLDWDMVIHGDAALREYFASMQDGALAVYNINGQDIIWNATQRKQLTYCVSNTFGTQKAAVIDAMAKASDGGWERMADVNWTYVATEDANCVASNTNVMMDVNPVNSGGQYLARSFFPNDTRANRNILIDTMAFDPANTGNIPLSNILGHELGHTIGFRHEHIRPEANATQCAEDNNFRGLTPYDSASVMHYPQCNGTASTLAFTTMDQQGVVALYGAPAANMPPTAQVTFPADNATVAPTFKVQASLVDTDIAKGELLIDGTVYQTLTAAPFVFQVTDATTGTHALEIRATDASGQSTSATLTVTVAAGGQTGDDTGSGSGTNGNSTQDPAAPGNVIGGCSTGGGSTGILFALALGGLVIRRRR